MTKLSNYEKDRIALGIAVTVAMCVTIEKMATEDPESARELKMQLLYRGEPADVNECAEMTRSIILENGWGWWGRSAFLSLIGAYLRKHDLSQKFVNDFNMRVTELCM